MKKGLKILLGVIIAIYLTVVIFLTVCLLNYNKYNITEFKNSSLIIVEDDALAPKYTKGNLVVVKKSKPEEIKVGDEIFFYNTYENQVSVSYTEVIATEKITEEETTYTLKGDKKLSSSNVIGKGEGSKVYKSAGKTLKTLSSRWGYLFCIVVPILLAFIYEIYAVVKEIKHPKEKNK